MFHEFKISDVFYKIDTPKIKAKANDFPTEYSEEYCVPLLTAGAENQGFNESVLNNTKISLPVTPSGEPDWDYMEQYIRAMEKVVIADVVKWKDKEIEATKTTVNKTI